MNTYTQEIEIAQIEKDIKLIKLSISQLDDLKDLGYISNYACTQGTLKAKAQLADLMIKKDSFVNALEIRTSTPEFAGDDISRDETELPSTTEELKFMEQSGFDLEPDYEWMADVANGR